MILALDVHYRNDHAKAVSVAFKDWQDAPPQEIKEVLIEEVADYIPGQFYKRELPCLLKVLAQTPREQVDLIIIDGYVFLDDAGRPGLGYYLYEALDKKIPIVGVAKRAFKNNKKHVREILRGKSKNPLFITSVGIELEVAAEFIQEMPGKYRMPDMLRLLDQTTKE